MGLTDSNDPQSLSRFRSAYTPGLVMARCKNCKATIQAQVAHQSFHQIKHLYQMQGMAPNLVEELTKRHGPMCEECLAKWRKEHEREYGPGG